jgi:phosphatidylinositol-3-phosphatase
MVVMMENESASDLLGNAAAPNTNALARQYGEATQSFAVAHPSLPNYLEVLSGSSQGVTDDGSPATEHVPAGTETLVNQLQAAGISWRAYMESMPTAGYTGGDSTCCGGHYYEHHDPFVYFPAVTSMPGFGADVVPSAGLVSDLDAPDPPDFVWVTPNGADDMHDGPMNADGDVSPSVGDAWLGSFVSQVQASAWYEQHGTIVIEWDEGADADTSGIGHAGAGGGGHILTIVVSAALKAAPVQDTTPVNTAGLLRSIEGAYGLPFLGDAGDPANGDIDALLHP